MKKFFILFVLTSSCPLIWCRKSSAPDSKLDDLEIFQAQNTNLLTKIVRTVTNDMVVGGRNVLYKLDSNLEVLSNLTIGPQNDNPLCYPNPTLCSLERKLTNNDVKVLLIYQKAILIVCGSVNQGMCNFYFLKNFNQTMVIGDPLKPVNYIAGSGTVAAFFSGNNLFSASTYDGRPLNMSEFFMTSKVLSRDKASIKFEYAEFSEASITGVDFSFRFKPNYLVRYIYGFSHNGFAYFITVQRMAPRLEEYESRIVRVCENDNRFFSYTEIPIKCHRESGTYKLATAAFLADSVEATRFTRQSAQGVEPPKADKVLYVTFAKAIYPYADIPDPERGSVLCRFPMSQIEDSFRNVTRDCFNGEPGRSFRLESILETKAKCVRKPDFDPEEAICDPGGDNNFMEGSATIPGGLKASFTGIASSLFVTVQHSDPVAFVGTESGNILKVPLKKNDPPVLYNVSLANETTDFKAIQASHAVDKSHENLFVLTGNKVVKFPIGSCLPYRDCRSCLVHQRDDPLECGWCGTFCAHEGECDSKLQIFECPPTITEVTPLFGPTQGQTLITIHGDNFGNAQGSLNVTINDISCDVIVWKNQTVQCRTRNSSATSAKIRLSVNSNFENDPFDAKGVVFSKEEFTFVTPKFFGIRPTFGPKAGGTNVTVLGEHLNIGHTRAIKLVGVNCEIQSMTESEIQCRSGSLRSSDNTKEPILGTAAICIDTNCLPAHIMDYNNNHPNEEDKVHSYFKYLENPFIHSITPSVTTKSGGMNLTIFGQYFNNVKRPQLSVKVFSAYTGKSTEFIQDCYSDDKHGKKLICPTPALDANIPVSERGAPLRSLMSFLMDGVEELRNFSQTHPKLSELLYYPDPIYHKFDGPRNVFNVPVDDPIVEIQGNHLNLAQTKRDVTVIIQGPTPCNVTKIDSLTLYCIIPQNFVPSQKNDTLRSVEVFAGKLHFNVGYIQFVDPSTKLSIAGIVCIVISIIVAILIVLFVLYKKRIIFNKRKSAIPGYAVAFNAEDENGGRTENDYSDHLMAGRTTSNSRGQEAATCGSGEASASSRTSLFGNKVSEETLALLEADNILMQRNNLTVLDVIGQGHFGRVYKGILKFPGKEGDRAVAVKSLQNSRYRDNEDVDSFLQEGLMMKDFHHHNVLTLIGVCFEDDGFPMVILPFMAHGDLLSYIRDENNYPTVKDLLTFGIDIAEGMRYLSDLKFVHRDLAARNCMIDEDLTLKVADFGLSRDIYERDYYSSDNKKSKLPVKWMAPESLEKGTYSNKSDVWSYGVVLWELMTRGITPYPEVDNWEILQYVKSGRRMLQPSFCPELLYQLMLHCWAEDSKSRPSFAEISEEMKEIIRKMESKHKHMRVGTKNTYYNCPVQDGDASGTETPILNGRH